MTRIERNSPEKVSYGDLDTPITAPQQAKPRTSAPSTTSAGTSALLNRRDSVQRTLERDPAQAERRIADRLRGSSSTDREIVKLAIEQRGNKGLRRYADAEQVLRALGPFDKDQRADILASMKVGTRFSAAVKDERASLAVPVQYESNSGAAVVADLQKSALGRSKAEAEQVSELSRNVMTLNREIGKVSRFAEVVAGGGSAAGLVGGTVVAAGESAFRRSSVPLGKIGHRTEVAGRLMAGDLTDEIALANLTTQKFVKLTGTFTDARSRFERAVHANDFEGMARYSKDMAAASKEMNRLASSLAAQAKSIAQLQTGMDHAVIETAITVVLASVSLAKAGHLVHGVGDAAKHVIQEGLMERAAGEVVNRASTR